MVQALIKTGVDKLVDLISKEKKLSLTAAAKKLGVNIANVEEWADFLEEEELITVDHTLSGTFLLPRKLTKAEIKVKTQEYKGEKDAFMRKVGSVMSNVEREAEDIKLMRTEFKNLHKEIGDDLEKVQDELGTIDKFRDFEQKINEKKSEFEKSCGKNTESMNSRLNMLQKRLDSLSQVKTKKEKDVSQKEEEVAGLIQKEQRLMHLLDSFEKSAEDLQTKIKKSDKALKLDQKELTDLKTLQETFKKDVEKSRTQLNALAGEQKEKQAQIKEMEGEFLSKLKKSAVFRDAKLADAKKLQSTFQDFFEKHEQVKVIMETLEGHYDELERQLEKLAEKAVAYDITLKSGESIEYVKELEQELNNLNKKRSIFQKEFQKLRNVLRTRAQKK
ncbi:hypothetical protein ACFL96_07685 [Thermoproteota archaeon]